MKKLSGIAPFVFFPLLLVLRKKRIAVYIFICSIIVTLSSCFLNFYKTNTTPSIEANTASKLSSENKYFIIHFSNSTNGLEQVHVQGDTLYGKIVQLPPEHSLYLNPDVNNKKNRIKARDKKTALMEVHLYTNLALQSDSSFSASITSFNRADVYELNKSATTGNHILSAIGLTLAGILVIGSIALAIACNCPQVYVNNNNNYEFTSGLYSGAVYSTLERNDYLPLNTIPYDAKEISFKIANAKNEEQFINKVQLLQVNHPDNVEVLADRHGNIFSYKNIELVKSASTDEKNNIDTILMKRDDNYYSFNNTANTDGFSDVELKFNKPAKINKAKLIIHARNTFWGGLLHKEFLSLFGDSFEKWREKQEKADPKELEKWQTDQALPLMVYMKTSEGWKFIDYFPLVGNTANRDMIMEINTEDVKDDVIELKLETTYRFWDLDFAGIDYSEDRSFSTKIIEPEEVLKSDSTNEKQALQKSDKAYTHLSDDEFVSFRYSVSPAPENNKASYFIVSGGYYHPLEHITGKTNYTELYKFQKKGAFDKFSREKYKEAENILVLMRSYNKQK